MFPPIAIVSIGNISTNGAWIPADERRKWYNEGSPKANHGIVLRRISARNKHLKTAKRAELGR